MTMAKIPDLAPWGAEFLLCDSAGTVRVLVRPQGEEHRSALSDRLHAHGFAWSDGHHGFVANRSLSARDLDGIFPGLTLVDGERVRKIPAITANAWIDAQDDRISARDIAFGDHEKLCLDIEHGRRQMTQGRAIALIASAERAGVLDALRAGYMRGKVASWCALPSPGTPAWYTPIPSLGLPVLPGDSEHEGYRRVLSRMVVDAMDAVTRDQMHGVSAFRAYVLPSHGPDAHGRVRFLPTDQPAPAEPWSALCERSFRLGYMARGEVERQLTELLMSQPILAHPKLVEKQKEPWDPTRAKQTMTRDQFIEAALENLTARRALGKRRAFTGIMGDTEHEFRKQAGAAWDAANQTAKSESETVETAPSM